MFPKAGETAAMPYPKAERQRGRAGGGGKGEGYYRILSAYTLMHAIGFKPHSLKENGTQREWHYWKVRPHRSRSGLVGGSQCGDGL